MANTGPMPITAGSQPAAANDTKRASGLRPSAAAFSALMTTAAAAPSLVCEELPAVTVPFFLKTGLRAWPAPPPCCPDAGPRRR